MTHEHPERPDPDPLHAPDHPDESPADRDGDTEEGEREEPRLPGIVTGDEPDISG